MAVCIGYLTTDSNGVAQCSIPDYSVTVHGDSYFDTVKKATEIVTAFSFFSIEADSESQEPEGIPIVLSSVSIEELRNV